MKLFITGANGFLGTAVVASAHQYGHDIVAMVRDAAKFSQPGRDQPTQVIQGDLRAPAAWKDALVGCDAVIHLAASFTDFYTQFASTVQGTEQLLQAMTETGVDRLVLVSTFSIYDYRALQAGAALDENSPLESRPQDLDDYTKTKLVQEQLVAAFAANGGKVTVLRPGAIYGPGKMWDAGMTLKLASGTWLAIGPNIRQKLTFVDNCAEAIILAAQTAAAIGETLNIVDDETPTQRQYATALKSAGYPVPRGLPFPFRMVRAGASVIEMVNQRRYHGKAKIPWYAVPAKLDQRFKQLSYPNDKAKAILGWKPRFNLQQGIAESLRRERLNDKTA
jgi:2-alkyl-3-oxoalkanoate reductase